MQKIKVSLSVYHDGQFFAALFERTDERGYSAAKRTFAAKPSDAEVLAFVLEGYAKLSFSAPRVEDKAAMGYNKNPKRRQREAAKCMRSVSSSTKAQAALKSQYEQRKMDTKKKTVADKKAMADARFAHRTMKRKQKHKGR